MLLFAMAWFCKADTTSDLARENAELKQRVDKLEKELEELKKLVMQQSAVAKTETKLPTPETKPVVTPQLSETDLQKILAAVQKETEKKKPVWSNLDIQLYGHIKADASYDTSRTNPGNYVLWADSEATNKNDDEFNLTANETRLGMIITGPEDQGIITSGRFEIDFYGNYADENKAKIQMRHAYLKIDWPQDRFNIIAGQTSDVISPLVPNTLNYTVFWDAGNIGYRRPQIRLTKILALRNNVDLTLEGAVARTIGRSNSTLGLAAVSESGEDAGFPAIFRLEGRDGFLLPQEADFAVGGLDVQKSATPVTSMGIGGVISWQCLANPAASPTLISPNGCSAAPAFNAISPESPLIRDSTSVPPAALLKTRRKMS